MAVFPVVKGLKIRATKVNSCGLPIAGDANYAATSAFVSTALSPVMNDAVELLQKNADNQICVLDRTPPQRKYYKLTLVLCQANTCLISMFNSWQQELDYNGDAVGFRDQTNVIDDYGVALETWAGGQAGSDCPEPTTDDIFANPTSGKVYGYLLTFGKEFQLGDIEISAAVVNFTLTGITFAGPQWGRGPWNVVALDGDNTAGRLLTPMTSDQQVALFRTPIDPPADTPGSECCPLNILDIWVDDNYYFGGPSNAPASDIAPNQPGCGANAVQTLSITGTPSSGTFTLTYNGQTTSDLAYTITAADLQTALVALTNIPSDGVVCTGGALPGTPIVITFVNALGGVAQNAITVNNTSLVGGSAVIARTVIGG